MIENFFATTVDDWDDPGGMLHAYLIPDEASRGRLDAAAERLGGIDFLALQPSGALHVTVQRLRQLVRDLDSPAVSSLVEASSQRTELRGPVVLEFGPARPCRSGVVSEAAAGAEWHEMIRLVREAATASLGADAVSFDPPSVPHITLAYAIGAGADAPIHRALEGVPSIGPILFQEIVWCAVHQNRRAGTYTFDRLAATPLDITGP